MARLGKYSRSVLCALYMNYCLCLRVLILHFPFRISVVLHVCQSGIRATMSVIIAERLIESVKKQNSE